MFHYVYYPFPKASASGANASVLKRFTEKYSSSVHNSHDENVKNHPGSILRYKGDSLNDINDDDMLLISSHGGSADPNTINSDLGNKETFNKAEKLTANDLAEQLNGAGLPKGHVLIKMLSCYAAGQLTLSGTDLIRTGIGGEDFFAKRLAIALKKNYKFNSIIVGGYSGPLLNSTIASRRTGRGPMTGNEAKYNRVDVNNSSPVDSHDHIYWFDGDGSDVKTEKIKQLKRESNLKQGRYNEPSSFQKSKGYTEIFKRN